MAKQEEEGENRGPMLFDSLSDKFPDTPHEALTHLCGELSSVSEEECTGVLSSLSRLSRYFTNLRDIPVVMWERFKLTPLPEVARAEEQYNPPADETPLKCRERPIVAMMNFVGECHNLFYTSCPALMAPYLAVVQSSGMGKTTCLYELTQWYTHSAFLLLREESRNSLLPSEMNVADRNTSEASTVEIMEIIRKAAACTSSDHAGNEMKNAIQKMYDACLSSSGTHQSKARRRSSSCENEQTFIPAKERDNIVLLVLDEASALCNIKCHYKKDERRNAFILFRRELASFCGNLKKKHLVVIVADTTSRIANFVPSERDIQAYNHPREQFGWNLFPVVHLPMYFDALAPGREGWKGSFRLQSVQRCYGRPLWDRTQASYSLVARKLLLNMAPKLKSPFGQQKTEQNHHLALLGCRIAVQFVQTSLVSELVAHSTAVCQSVSVDRNVITCKYMSEPWVAEASACFCDQHQLSLWEPLRDAVVSRNVLAGDAGEFVAQKVILDAYDRCVEELPNTSPNPKSPITRMSYIFDREDDKIPSVALMDLLKQLSAGGARIAPVQEQLKAIGQENVHVFFNHFIQLEEKITPELVRQAMRRCCALVLAPGATGADLCLPAFHPETEKLSLLVWIQVKNRNAVHMTPSRRDTWWKHLARNEIMPPSPSGADEVNRMIPSLSILFSMNPDYKSNIPVPSAQTGVPLAVLAKQSKKSLDTLKTEHKADSTTQKDFWRWLLDEKASSSCSQSTKRMRRLCSQSQDMPGFVAPTNDKGYEELYLQGFSVPSGPISFASIQMPHVLTSSSYTVTEIACIRQILQASELQQSTVFDPQEQTEITRKHILSQVKTLRD